ncbi:MAG: zinc/iron-chelating domain-containing protein [Thermodesulfobacteriota bacterium]
MDVKGVCEAMDRLINHKIVAPNSAGNPAICGECALHGPTCCRCGAAETDVVAPLSAAEWRQIQRLAPWAMSGEFVASERNTPRFIHEMQRLFPDNPAAVEAAFPLDATHLRLAQNSVGQCVFLGVEGCLLPGAARPFFCQLYPFWLIDGHLFALGDPRCRALQTLDSTATMLAAFGTHPARLRATYHRLRLAWGLGPPARAAAGHG